MGADLAVFPELCLCGYPPEDLLLKKHFSEDNMAFLDKLAGQSGETAMMVGFAEYKDGKCFNSLAVLQQGQIREVYRKNCLPNYGVFDEKRYFEPGTEAKTIEIDGVRVGLTVCEDIWDINKLNKSLGSVKLDMIINISASPFHIGKITQRRQILSDCAKTFGCAVGYCNLIGGQDELVFDGQSMVVGADGIVLGQCRPFEEDILIFEIEKADAAKQVKINKASIELPAEHPIDILSEIYQALVIGTRDYTIKNGFGKVLVGLSGGIDSALTAAIAAAALGSENVVGITMPSRFNSEETISDAKNLAENLGIEFHTVPIEDTLAEFDSMLSQVAGWDNKGVAYENLQARIRGSILMSLSNRFGYLVLTTGNKSETAVGYSTLYGDTAGGFAVIKDVPKTIVYELCRYINKAGKKPIIPQSVIERIPSAELRENQKDSDSLPDYELLDKILKGYVEEDKSAAKLISFGLEAEVVKKVIRMVDRNEYKRRQSPPGIKITPKAFGRDRRLPITNQYTNQHLNSD